MDRARGFYPRSCEGSSPSEGTSIAHLESTPGGRYLRYSFAMSVRVEWVPPEGLVEQVLYRDAILLAYLAGTTSIYDDPGGLDASVYRVTGNPGFDTGPFQMPVNRAADIQTRVRFDHDWGLKDVRRYTDAGGNGVRVSVRIYREADWVGGRRTIALAVVNTDADGRWPFPVFLEAGLNYVLHVQGEGFGPLVETVTL